MKIQRVIFSASLATVLAFASYGIAMAEDEPEVSDQQYCEMDADEAGMIDERDIREYVAQCLDELRRENDASETELEPKEVSGEKW